MQDSSSTSTSSTELHVSNDGASTSTSMITACTANSNLSLSTIGYGEDEGCLIDLDFDYGNSITGQGKEKSSNGVLLMDDKLSELPFVSSEILLPKKASMPSSARMTASISSMGN